MYKDTDITVVMIQESFPDVAASIVAAAAVSPSISAESLRESHPDIVAAFMNEGRSEASIEVAAAVEADRERVLTIQAMARPGYENIISAAVADSGTTPDQVKIQLFDAMQGTTASAHALHKEDGKELGTTLAQLSGGSAEGGEEAIPADVQAEDSMEAAGKKSRGEK